MVFEVILRQVYKSVTFYPQKGQLMIRKFQDIEALDINVLLKLQNILLGTSESDQSGDFVGK